MRTVNRIIAMAAVVAISLLGFGVAPSTATPYSGAHIELITPTLTADNTSEAAKNQALAETWVVKGWFGSGLKFQRAFAPVGSRIVLTYRVTDANGNPLAGEAVALRMNKQYSESTAQITVDGVRAKAATTVADGARVTHITDQFGYVSYVVQNLDTDGETQPAKFTDAPIIPNPIFDDVHAQFLPQVLSEPKDHSVITEFHYYTPSSDPVAPSVTAPTMRLIAPALTDTNSIHRTDMEAALSSEYAAGLNVRQVYAKVGSTNSLVYSVRDDAGNPAAGQSVTLKVGRSGSGSNAKVSDTTYGNLNTPANTALTNADQATWTATTDPFGTALFTLKNTDVTGENFPATFTTNPPATAAAGAKFTQLWLSISGSADIGDLIEVHFHNPALAAPALKTGAAISGLAKVGKSLLLSKGTWSAFPAATATYKWYRCSVNDTKSALKAPVAASKCTLIATAKTSSYKVTAADKGKFIRGLVTVKNSKGTAYSLTRTTAKVS